MRAVADHPEHAAPPHLKRLPLKSIAWTTLVCLTLASSIACTEDLTSEAPDMMPEPEMMAPDLGEEIPAGQEDMRPTIGESCTGPAVCGDEALCASANDRFQCMRTCAELDRICPTGEVCTSLGASGGAVCYLGGATMRYQPCTSNLECVAGNLCFGTGESRYCLPACHREDADVCDATARCVQTSGDKGYCDDLVGQNCQTNADCVGGLQCSSTLAQETADFFLAGMCTTQCDTDTDCPGDARCRAVTDGGPSICLDGCDTGGDASCRFNIGEVCLSEVNCAMAQDPMECARVLDGATLCVPPL